MLSFAQHTHGMSRLPAPSLVCCLPGSSGKQREASRGALAGRATARVSREQLPLNSRESAPVTHARCVCVCVGGGGRREGTALVCVACAGSLLEYDYGCVLMQARPGHCAMAARTPPNLAHMPHLHVNVETRTPQHSGDLWYVLLLTLRRTATAGETLLAPEPRWREACDGTRKGCVSQPHARSTWLGSAGWPWAGRHQHQTCRAWVPPTLCMHSREWGWGADGCCVIMWVVRRRRRAPSARERRGRGGDGLRFTTWLLHHCRPPFLPARPAQHHRHSTHTYMKSLKSRCRCDLMRPSTSSSASSSGRTPAPCPPGCSRRSGRTGPGARRCRRTGGRS